MHHQRAIRIALKFGAGLLLLCLSAATMDTDTRQPAAPSTAIRTAASADPAAAPASDASSAVAEIFESTLDFLREVSRSLEHGGYSGAIIRLLIVVEVLIATLGVVSTVTVGGKVTADLVYRIVDVMGALFIILALLLLGMTAL